jgi:cold shock CspA family protein
MSNEKRREPGEVVTYFASKGFGFIKPSWGGATDAFLHINNMRNRATPYVGAKVMFESSIDRKKRLIARDVEIVEE